MHERSVRMRVGCNFSREAAYLLPRSVPDNALCFRGLLADVVGNIGQVAFVGANGREVIGLADQVESAQGFPDLVVRGIDHRDLRSCCNIRSGSGYSANAAGNWRADFCNLFAPEFQLGDQATLVDSRSGSI